MGAMKLTDQKEQKDARPSSHSRAPVIWPWVLVIAAWTVVLLATLTKQTSLINHNYLLTQSHLSWIAALVVFLVSWQVMTIAMMLPSSMPLVSVMVHASQRRRHPWATQVVFFGGICIRLDRLRARGVPGRHAGALAGQQLVLALYAFLADRRSNLCNCRRLSIQPT
jgi:hypothetical protein